MPTVDVEQERTNQLLTEIADLTDSDPATMIAWYDALSSNDRVRFLKGFSLWQAQLQRDSYLVLRIGYAMMGILARGENGDN